jgi:hypothetical protein
MAKRRDPWTSLAFDSWSLGLEASTVIGLRMMKLAAGGAAAQTEAKLMVGEKMAAGHDPADAGMTGQLGATGSRRSPRDRWRTCARRCGRTGGGCRRAETPLSQTEGF